MPRTATYRVIDRPDGLFDIAVTLRPDRIFHRTGLASRAEVDEALSMLRDLMAACGAPLVQEPAGQPAKASPAREGAKRTVT